MDNKTCKFLATTLQSYIVDKNELEETIPKIFQNNSYLTETYGKCLRQLSGDVADSSKSCTIIEIDSILDYLHDELNTGHWSEVPVAQRQGFTAASYIKAIILIIRVANGSEYYGVELLRDCLKCIDMGLLLGAPLTNNPDLLTDCARFLSERIGSVSECPLTSNKRKHCDDSRRYRGDYDKLQKAIEIEALSKPSLQKFYRDYFVRQKPVKLLDCMSHWPAMTKWLDVGYLVRIAGDRTVPVEIGSHYADENWSQKLMPLKEFITKHFLSSDTEDGTRKDLGYLAQHNLFDQITELRNDIYIPDYCSFSSNSSTSATASEDAASCTEPDINAWFGPKGTVSPLHHDPKNNLLAQVFGTKQLLLFSPDDSPYLYPHTDKMLCNTARVNPLAPDLVAHRDFPQATMYKCLLEPGEMLYIPVKWWHHVTALDKSFSVSFWWQ